VTTVIDSQRESLDCGYLSAQVHLCIWPTLCCSNKKNVVGYVRDTPCEGKVLPDYEIFMKNVIIQ
jgi:hypothetical protein